MLLNFSVRNFCSFKEKATLNMIPSRTKILSYSVLKNGKFKALSTNIIYGSNAAGKTSLLQALYILKNFVFLGNVKNFKDDTQSFKMQHLELIKNINADNKDTVDFNIEFEKEKSLYKYNLKIDLDFYSKKEATVVYENLCINNEIEFERISNKLNYVDNSEFYEGGLQNEDLFLCNGYKILDLGSYKKIFNWFSEKLIIILNIEEFAHRRFDSINYEDGLIQGIATAAGTYATIEGYEKDNKIMPVSVIETKYGEEFLPSLVFESFGTMKLIGFLPYLRKWFHNGATVLIDEFDSSLHSLAVINLINIFHNNEINLLNAQLIFTTHNPIYLGAKIFRNDEISIVDKNENGSVIGRVSEIINNTEKKSILDKYMHNELGGISDIDFSDLFINTTAEESCNDK